MNDKIVKRIAIQVHGKVQGVFFRASTQQKARELGLSGYVRNEKDGTVYLEAEGDPQALQMLEAWVRVGPGQAQVTQVEVEEMEELARYNGFEQRR